VRSADFSISQFQFLLRLLIFQGRNGYLRVSSMICYYFYKNIVLVLTELYFPFFNGFSGQIYFLDWLPMMYNAIFTSWHSLFTLLLEKDVNYHFTYRYPQIYKAGQLRLHFNYMVFWKWIILAVWHGVVCYFLPIIVIIQSFLINFRQMTFRVIVQGRGQNIGSPQQLASL
jgi:phospholipid-transporting ATPase